MADLTSADVTVTVLSRRIEGQKRKSLVSIAFGDGAKTYPQSGVPMPAASSFGLVRNLEYIQPVDFGSRTDIVWKYDYQNGNIRGYREGAVPFLVVEEAVTLASQAGTLKYPPAYIIAVSGTVSAADAGFHVIPQGITPATKQVAVNWTSGGLQFFATDDPSAVKVTYVPQQPSGFFSYSNMVIDEVITLSSAAAVPLANRAGAFQYIYRTTAAAKRLVLAQAAASGKVVLDMLHTNATHIEQANAAENNAACKVTYLKYAGLQQPGVEFVDQASVALTSENKEWTLAANTKGLVMPGVGTQLLGKETTNVLEIALVGPSITAAAGIATWSPTLNKILTKESSAQTTIEETSFLQVDPVYSTTSRSLRELASGQAAPAAVTLYGEAVGW